MADEPLIDIGGCLKRALAETFVSLIPEKPVRVRCGRCRAHCLVLKIEDGESRIEDPYLLQTCAENEG